MAVQTCSTTQSKNTEPPHDPALEQAAEWKVARAKALLEWATADAASGFMTKNVAAYEVDQSHIAAMDECADWLAKLEPVTVLGAREMLNVVLTILAYREIFPDQDRLSDGPILQILRNVRQGLDWLDGEIVLKA